MIYDIEIVTSDNVEVYWVVDEFRNPIKKFDTFAEAEEYKNLKNNASKNADKRVMEFMGRYVVLDEFNNVVYVYDNNALLSVLTNNLDENSIKSMVEKDVGIE